MDDDLLERFPHRAEWSQQRWADKLVSEYRTAESLAAHDITHRLARQMLLAAEQGERWWRQHFDTTAYLLDADEYNRIVMAVRGE